MSKTEDPEDLRERVDELEAQLDEQQTLIQQMLPSRRDLLKAGGAGVAGLLLGSATSGNAAAGSDSVGQIGTQANPVDAVLEDVYDDGGNQPMSFPGDGSVSIADTQTDPSSNGELQRNGTDVKVYSGGSVRNLSTIGNSGFSLPELARTDGWWHRQNFDSLNGMNQVTTGSGSISLEQRWLELSTGNTDDSKAQVLERFGEQISPLTWDKDRIMALGIPYWDTGGPVGTFWGGATAGSYNTNHIGVQVNNGDLEGSVSNGSSRSTTTLVSGIPVGTGNRVRIEFVSGTDVTFYVNGVQEGTISNNLPSGDFGAEKVAYVAENAPSGATDRLHFISQAVLIQHP
jgi:hypothetical protein